jgi:hypothetical protein
MVVGIIGLVIGAIGVLAAFYAIRKQVSAKKIMSTFIQTIAGHSQSVANSINRLKENDFTKHDVIKGKIDEISISMNSLNGSIQNFYKKHYKKNKETE